MPSRIVIRLSLWVTQLRPFNLRSAAATIMRQPIGHAELRRTCLAIVFADLGHKNLTFPRQSYYEPLRAIASLHNSQINAELPSRLIHCTAGTTRSLSLVPPPFISISRKHNGTHANTHARAHVKHPLLSFHFQLLVNSIHQQL